MSWKPREGNVSRVTDPDNKCEHLLSPNYIQVLCQGLRYVIRLNLHNHLLRWESFHFPLVDEKSVAKKAEPLT